MKLIRLGVLLNILVLKCWAMTRIELQEFSDFLEKTSQLDLKLKSNPDIEADDDETALDNAWEESGKFEGDLVLNERQRRLIVEDVAEGLSRNGLRDSTKRWPNNEVVYYVQPEHFNEEQLQAIQNGIDDIAQASCVKFRRYHKGDRDAVVIQGSRRGCFSQVGYQGGYQVLNLSGRHPVGRGCFRHGTVVHELLHTLGFYHMQSSPDRDDYIDVIWENILQPARHNFRKYNTFAVSDFGVGYDFESVLHYSKKAFSSNGQDTLVPKQNDADIGQRVGLSQKDTQKLNKMYCDVDSNNDDTGSNISQKKRNQKESLKNKPFEGHGIGYHQGKTVIIKLPAADTHVLPDLSKFYTFDYFSKTSQAVPETNFQNSRFGGRIATSRDMVTHVENKTLKPSISSDDFPYKYDISTIKEAKLSGKNNTSDLTSKENEENYQSNTEKVKEIKSANEEENNMPRLNIANELKDINKIIKSYVYPSEETGGYKIKNDYSTFSVPKKVVLHDEFDPNNRITRLYESGNQFDSNSGDIKSKSLKPIDSYEEEVDSPFNNPFAVNKMNYFIHKYDPNSLKENLNRRNYYQQLNTQNRQNHPNKNNLNRHIESKMYTDDGDMDSYLNNRYNQNLLMHELHKNAPNYSQQSKWW